MISNTCRQLIRKAARAAPLLAFSAAAQQAVAEAGPVESEPGTVREKALAWMKQDELRRAAELTLNGTAGGRAVEPGRLSGIGPVARMRQDMAAAFKPHGFASEDFITADGLRATRVRSGGVSYCASALPVHTIMGERMREQGFTVKQVACPSH